MFLITQLKQSVTLPRIVACVLYAALPALLFYLLALGILTANGFSIAQVLRDPAQLSGESSFLGFLSNIGSWLWVSAVAICFFHVLTARIDSVYRQREMIFLLGLLSLALAVDDFFLLHDRFVYAKGLFLFYAVCAFTLLVRYFRTIVEVDAFPFLLAGFLLAASIEIDIHQKKFPFGYTYAQILEEGCKFTGAAIWLYFCARAAAYRSPAPAAGDRDQVAEGG